jgi:hypothetical protein
LDETTAGDLIESLAHPVKTGFKHGAKMITDRKMFEKGRRAREAKLNKYREDLSRLFTAQGPERDAILRWIYDTMDEAPRARGGRVDRNRGGLARLHNNKAMKAKRLHGTPFKPWNDIVGRAEGGRLRMTPDGLPYYEASDLPESDQLVTPELPGPSAGVGALPPISEDPFERAALRQRRGVGSERGLNQRAVSAPEDTSGVAEKVDWMLEPMLEQQQKGEFVPEGRSPDELAVDEFGRLIDKHSFEPIKMIERPGMLPLVKTPKGVEFAMPKVLDVAGYLGGGWGAKVPVRGAETVLGAGLVRPAKIGPDIPSEAGYAYHATNVERAKDIAKHGLKTHRPWQFTDQGAWPDGSVDPRSYFTPNAGSAWQFAPEEGQGLLLRTKADRLKRESTGDLYSREKIKPGELEFLGDDGKFHPLSSLEPLKRQVLERGRSGRPIKTEPLSQNADQAILEQGAENIYRANPAPQFFSALERAIDNAKMNKGTPDQWLGYLRNQPGVKAEELEWVRPLEGAQGHLTKQQLQELIGQKKVQLEETNLGGKHYDPDKIYVDEYGSQYGVFDDGEIVAGPFERRISAEDAMTRLMDEAAKTRTRYSDYQLPGGTNYRELLLRMPEPKRIDIRQNKTGAWEAFDTDTGRTARMNRGEDREWMLNWALEENKKGQPKDSRTFRSLHWPDHPNPVAHVRMNDRDIPGVGRSLHLEEIQSDWGQKGRKEGFALSEAEKKRLASEEDRIIEKMSHDPETGEFKAKRSLELGEITKEEAETFEKALRRNANKVPNMPFKSTWPDLALKRMIREAAEKNYDAISWTPGEAQAARYDLSKQVGSIRANKNSDGTFSLFAWKKGAPESARDFQIGDRIPKDKIADYVGKDLADKIINQQENSKAYTGLDLKVGGEGMRAFYDKMLVDKANALGKKYGARVDVKYLPEVKKSDPIASIMEGYGVAKEQAAEILNDLGPAIRSGNKNKLLDEIESADIVPDYPELLANRLLGISSQPVMVMKLTPAMKRAALREGFPLFSGAPLPTGAVQTEQERAAGGAVHKAARNAMRRK